MKHKKYMLKLYLVGDTPEGRKIEKELTALFADELAGEFELSVVDILEFPDQAEREKIYATPTLVKAEPLPARRIIGDLCVREKVLSGLELENADCADERRGLR